MSKRNQQLKRTRYLASRSWDKEIYEKRYPRNRERELFGNWVEPENVVFRAPRPTMPKHEKIFDGFGRHVHTIFFK